MSMRFTIVGILILPSMIVFLGTLLNVIGIINLQDSYQLDIDHSFIERLKE
jgi:hypothetical protein